MWIAAKFFLCVCLFPTDVFSGNERSHTEDNTESHQEALEQFPTSILEEVLGDYKLLREDVLSLRTTHFLMQAEINELKENQRESAKRITEIEHENIHLRKENSYLRRLTKDANTKNHLQNGTFQQNHISKRLLSPAAVVPSTSQIAFSTLMNSNIVDPHDNKIFMFDNIIVNSGNAYNKNNGMFTAPSKGYTLFLLLYSHFLVNRWNLKSSEMEECYVIYIQVITHLMDRVLIWLLPIWRWVMQFG